MPGGLNVVAAFVGYCVFIGSVELEFLTVIITNIAFTTTVGLRLISFYFGLELPKPRWGEGEK